MNQGLPSFVGFIYSPITLPLEQMTACFQINPQSSQEVPEKSKTWTDLQTSPLTMSNELAHHHSLMVAAWKGSFGNN